MLDGNTLTSMVLIALALIIILSSVKMVPQGYNWTVDCVDGDDDTIVRSIFEAFDDREILREEQRVALDRGIARMSDYEEGLRKLFLSTARAA